MHEKISPGQADCLKSIVDILAACPTIVLERDVLTERWGLTSYEAEKIMTAVGLLFIKTLSEEEGQRYLKLQGKFAAKLVNKPPYSKATAETKNGFVHHQQRFTRTRGLHRKS